MDIIDRKILKMIQVDTRISNAELSRKLDMAPSAVHERIKKLEQKKIIDGYEVRLNPKSLDYGLAAFIFVKEIEGVEDWETAKQIAALPEVLEVHHIAGEDCLLVKVRAKDTDHLGRLLTKDLGKIKTVASTKTTIVLSTIKESIDIPLDLEEN